MTFYEQMIPVLTTLLENGEDLACASLWYAAAKTSLHFRLFRVD